MGGNACPTMTPQYTHACERRQDLLPSKWADVYLTQTGVLEPYGASLNIPGCAGPCQAEGRFQGQQRACWTMAYPRHETPTWKPSGKTTCRCLQPGEYSYCLWRMVCYSGDKDGVLNNGNLLPPGLRFTAAAVITTILRGKSDAWIHVNFKAGSHGSINAGAGLLPCTLVPISGGDIEVTLREYFARG